MARAKPLRIGTHIVRKGEQRDIHLKVSERYTGDPINMPLRVIRAKRRGPRVFICAAIHGDELNGLGIVHDIMFGEQLAIRAGALILIPVLNIFGFETQDRYMPDRRDLNRCFPGSPTGSLASRFAHTIFNEIVKQCDYGIDLHTAASARTNFPNVRGDVSDPEVRRIARAFGCELIIDSKGPDGSLRRAATKAGCATIVLEAGGPLMIEPSVLQVGARGVENVLKELGMIDGDRLGPRYQSVVQRSMWVRAELGGILRFHVAPGDLVEVGQPIATTTSVFGQQQAVLTSLVEGIVLGMTTLPAVKPGEPVCHIAIPRRSIASIRRALHRASPTSLHYQARHDLARSISVTEREDDLPSHAVDEDDA